MLVPSLIFLFGLCSHITVQATVPTCSTFGTDLPQSSSSLHVGFFVHIGTQAACPGNATAWNICYYSSTSDPTTTTSYFGVYRPSASGVFYQRVALPFTYQVARNTSSPFVCSRIPIPPSQQYVVLPSDVLAVCLKSKGSGYLSMVASSVTGATVLTSSSACTTAPTALVPSFPLSMGFSTLSSTTLHINLEVNECAVSNGGCGQICTDTTPGYTCSCYPGYALNPDGMGCSDINECLADNGNCSQVCTNTNGSYFCSCYSGYKLDPDGRTCRDIDECAVLNANCSQVCVNTNGSYYCSCYPGYRLEADNRTCDDINECATANGGCSQICINTNGSYFCLCQPGYLMEPNGKNCTDINECTEMNGNCSQTCTNTPGAFFCSCNCSYQLGEDGRTCYFQCPTNLPPGVILGGNARANTASTFSCPPGYGLVGNTSLDCNGDGTWSGVFPQCEEGVCSYAVGGTSHLRLYGTADYGSLNTFYCDFGYQLTGTANQICRLDGSWSGDSLPSCTVLTCDYLQLPSNGRTIFDFVDSSVQSPTLMPGDAAYFVCDQGYKLAGSNSTVCLASGAWNVPPPTCIVANCSSSSGDIHLRMEGSGAVNTSVTFSCDLGYKLSGSPSLSCNPDVTWSDALPSCIQVLCPEVTPPSGGSADRSSDANTLGSSVVFSCGQGYTLTGPATIVCQTDGTWSGPTPSCDIANCSSSSGDIHLRMEGSGVVNTSVTFSCDLGYVLSGSPSLSCNPDVTWSDALPSCIQVLCPEVTPPPGGSADRSSDANTLGSSVVFSCGHGYTLTGPATIVCQTDGTWSGPTPSCDIANCSSSSGDIHLRMEGSGAVNTSVTFSCDLGYKLSGSPSLSCNPDVTWSDALPSCIQVLCPEVTPPSGGSADRSSDANTLGSSVVFSCGQGYTLTGPATIVCQTDGTWSGPTPSCDVAKCSVGMDGHLHMNSSGRVGTVVSFSCDHGYSLNGSPTLTCDLDATWSEPLPSCTEIQCPGVTPPPRGFIVNGNTSTSNALPGDAVVFSCDDGYLLKGPDTIACLTNGTWSSPVPMCDMVNCSSDPAGPNLQTTPSDHTSLGTNVTFSCDPGYNLNGSSSLICLTTGQWNGALPSCDQILCPSIPRPQNGQLTLPGTTTIGSTATFSCDQGYSLVGSNRSTCQSDGTWDTPAPTCQIAQCRPFSDPHLHMNGTGAVGTNVTVWCDPAYSLSGGPDTIRCASDGMWSPNPPSCVINVCAAINVSALNDTSVTDMAVNKVYGAIPGSSVTFGCANGSVVIVKTIYCLSQGQWSAKPPFCSRASPPQPVASADSGNTAVVAGASAGSIIGVVLLTAAIAIIIWKRKRRGNTDIGLSIKAEDTSHLLDEEDDGSTNL